MDKNIHNIKMSEWLVSSPDRHTVHKTMRASCHQLGHKAYNSSPNQCAALCGLLNVNLMAVDFTEYCKNDRHFIFPADCLENCFHRVYGNWQLVPNSLSGWQCYIAKYP